MIFGLALGIAFGIWIGLPWWMWLLMVAASVESIIEAQL